MTSSEDTRDRDVGSGLSAVLARDRLRGTDDLEATLSAVTAAAVALIDGVDYAGVMLLDGETSVSRATTAAVVAELDAVQVRFQDGPCLRAALTDTVISSSDLCGDARWPGYAAAAAGAGVHSALSLPLVKNRHGGSALNLLGSRPGAIGHGGQAIAAMLATQAAVAVLAADRTRQFDAALASRDVIGQAKGMLMERFSVDAQHAFDLIKRLSQETNTPIRVLAQQITASPTAESGVNTPTLARVGEQ
jgi:hypothetical protein